MHEPDNWHKENHEGIYGVVYQRWCRAINNIFSTSPEKLKKNETVKKERFKKEEERYHEALIEFAKVENNYPDSHAGYKKGEKRFRAAERSYERAERIFKQEKFHKALDLLGMDVSVQEVMVFAGFLAVISLLLGVLIASFTYILLNITVFEAGIFLIPGILVAPLFTFAFVASYPEILAERVKTKSLGRSPEAVNYMVMSMRLSPSLSRAVSFAAESTEEPIASGLKKVLWDIYMRKHDSIEESFLDFAYEWGEINEDFKRSLYAIRSSMLERSEEGRMRILDKSQEIVLEGTKRRIQDFASSLHAPTTVLFALGILMPMIIGAMLPLMAMELPTTTNFETNPQTSNGTPDAGGALGIVLLMDVVFPLVAFVYAYHILGKRPGTASPPEVKSRLSIGKERNIASFSLLIFLGFGIFAIPYLREYLGGLGSALGPVPILLGVGFAVGYYLRTTTKHQKKTRDEIKGMEEEFPDALFKLGSRIAEGEPLETALSKVAVAMKGSEISKLFEKISYTIQITRSTPEDAMFGSDIGVLSKLPSRTIRATMKTVVECTRKDASTAGTTIINISNYLRDMKKMEHEIKTSLSQTVDMMKATGILFAPLVMGIVASLYVLLSNEFAMIPGSYQLLSNDIFFMVLGIYLILMVIVIIYFSVGIEHGEDSVELRYSIGNAVPTAMIVYALSLVCGQFLIG